MAERKIDRETGEVWWQMSDGSMIPQSELMGDEDIGKLDTFLINAGMTFSDIGRTLRSPFNERSDLADEQRFARESIAGINARNPVSAFAGSIAPSLATAPLSGGVGGMALLGGLEGLSSFREDFSDQLFSGGIGALGGALATKVMNKIQEAGAAARQIARQAKAADLPVTVGERLGSRVVKGAETALDILPGGASTVREGRQVVLNRAANQAMGVSGDKVTEESFEQASRQMGEVFQEVAAESPGIQMGEEFGEAFRTISSKFGKAAKLKKQTGMLEGGGGVISKGEYLDIRKTLADYGYSQTGTGNPLADVALQMVDQLDDELAATAGPALVQRYGRAREQFRMMKILQRGGTVKASQDVSAPLLNTGLRQNLDQAFFQPADALLKNPESLQLKNLTKQLVEPALNPSVGNSGTAERLLQGGGIIAGLGGLATGNPAVAGGVVAGAAGGSLLNQMLGSQLVGEGAEALGKAAANRIGGISRPINQALMDQILEDEQR